MTRGLDAEARRGRLVAAVVRAYQDALLAGDKVLGAGSPEDRMLHAIVAESTERTVSWLRTHADDAAVRPLAQFATRLTPAAADRARAAAALPAEPGGDATSARVLHAAGLAAAVGAAGAAVGGDVAVAAVGLAAVVVATTTAWRRGGQGRRRADGVAVVEDGRGAMSIFNSRVVPALRALYAAEGGSPGTARPHLRIGSSRAVACAALVAAVVFALWGLARGYERIVGG